MDFPVLPLLIFVVVSALLTYLEIRFYSSPADRGRKNGVDFDVILSKVVVSIFISIGAMISFFYVVTPLLVSIGFDPDIGIIFAVSSPCIALGFLFFSMRMLWKRNINYIGSLAATLITWAIVGYMVEAEDLKEGRLDFGSNYSYLIILLIVIMVRWVYIRRLQIRQN